MNQWLASLAYLLGGMTLKWVLDLFFLRHVHRENERRLSAREAEFTALKHEHAKALTDLRNRLTELEATSRAKSLAEASLANLNSSQSALRTHALRIEEELAACRAKEADLLGRSASQDQALQSAEARAASLEATVRRLSDDGESLRRCLSEAEARLAKLGGEEVALRMELDQTRAELADRVREAGELSGASNALRARVADLEVGLQGRDAEISDVRGRLVAVEAERDSVSSTLRSTDRELGLAREKMSVQAKALKESRSEAEALRAEADRAVADLRALQEAREGLERELASLRETVESPAEDDRWAEPDPAWVHRVQDLQAELEAVSVSHARLEQELAAEREQRLRLEQSQSAPPSPSGPPGPDVSSSEALLAEIDELNRERNILAAELAALKAAAPAPATSRRRKGRPVEAELFPMPMASKAEDARSMVLDEAIQPDPILDEPSSSPGEEA